MASWSKTTKHEPNEINKGNQYTRDNVVPIEQLNAITENSFYAVDKADEALTKANSAFENNGTVVSVGGTPVANLSFTSDPQQQIGEINTTNISQALEISGLHTAVANTANKDLSNVTYPEIVYDFDKEEFDGIAHYGYGDRVVENFISSDGNTWYRIWASGWKECGVIVSGGGQGTKTLPIDFSTTNYTVVGNIRGSNSVNYGFGVKPTAVNQISYTKVYSTSSSAGEDASVYCCGY